MTNAGGKWSGVRTRIGVNDEPPSAVCASVSLSSASTDSWVRLSTPRKEAVRPASTTPTTSKKQRPRIRMSGARYVFGGALRTSRANTRPAKTTSPTWGRTIPRTTSPITSHGTPPRRPRSTEATPTAQIPSPSITHASFPMLDGQ